MLHSEKFSEKNFVCEHHPHEKPLDNFRRLESCSIIFLVELHSPKHGSLESFRFIFLSVYIFFTSDNWSKYVRWIPQKKISLII